jgi:hypothetical protein
MEGDSVMDELEEERDPSNMELGGEDSDENDEDKEPPSVGGFGS